MAKTDFRTIDDYLASRDEDERAVLQEMRRVIHEAVPGAEEVISYQIPAFKRDGFVIYISAYAKHFGLSFPPPWKVFTEYASELAPYDVSKSAVQLPKSQPIPYGLIAKMAAFQAAQNAAAPKPKSRK